MDNPEQPQVATGRTFGAAALMKLVAVLALGVAATYAIMTMIVLAVPDGNDYALIAPVKQSRLADLPGQRIVLVGGSNLAYGIDSNLLQDLTGCPAVNMGMNGYFGIEYMVNEASAGARPGDIMVLAFEWDNFFKPVNGGSNELFMMLKTAPQVWSFLTPDQRWRALTEGFGAATRQKVLRVLGDALRGDLGQQPEEPSDEPEEPGELMARIETLAGFNEQGDLVSHLGITWPGEFDTGVITDQVDPTVVPAISQFVNQLEDEGIPVLVSYSPLARSAYDRHRDVVDEVYAQLTAAIPTHVNEPPSIFVYNDELFFDTIYHLDEEGRELRTRQLAQDINAYAGWDCQSAPAQEPA